MSPLAVILLFLAVIMAIYAVAPVVVGVVFGLGAAVQVAGTAGVFREEGR